MRLKRFCVVGVGIEGVLKEQGGGGGLSTGRLDGVWGERRKSKYHKVDDYIG